MSFWCYHFDQKTKKNKHTLSILIFFKKTIELGTKNYHGSKLSFTEEITNSLLNLIIRKKIKKKFGGCLQAFISGGAALNYQVGLFFQSLGINILQGYGQTECSPLISCNPINYIKIDTVGRVIRGLDVKISGNNEVLVKGDSVMKGYWKDQKGTNKAIINGLRTKGITTPIIGFPRGAKNRYVDFAKEAGVQALSIDQDINLSSVISDLPDTIVSQGNLDPLCLIDGGGKMFSQVDEIIEATRGRRHIFNLGHGILPETNPDMVEFLIKTVKDY